MPKTVDSRPFEGPGRSLAGWPCLTIFLPLHRNDVRGLCAFLTTGDLKVHHLPFLKRLKAIALNLRVMDKHILRAIFRSNEAVTLLIAKPFHRPSCHLLPTFLYRLHTGVAIRPRLANRPLIPHTCCPRCHEDSIRFLLTTRDPDYPIR